MPGQAGDYKAFERIAEGAIKRRPRGRFALCLAAALALLPGCAWIVDHRVVARSDDFVVVTAGDRDDLKSLAAAFLGDATKGWLIAEFNGIERVKAGQEVVIPLRQTNRAGIHGDGFLKVPILAYHDFVVPGRKCSHVAVATEAFEAQLAYLKERGYKVLTFKDLAAFIEGRSPVPSKSVILTVDDGFRSAYEIAYPLLKKYGFPATLFIYSDFIGAPAALSWAQMKEMVASGLIDVQPHSKTHSDLTKIEEGESEAAYRRRIAREVKYSSDVITRHLGLPVHTFSYPFGAENDTVMDIVKKAGFEFAVTVTRGGNPSFSHPLVLRRTQIYCRDDLKTFARRLDTFERIAGR